jgi:glycosyltransferase involved in cell wall biosynthesis
LLLEVLRDPVWRDRNVTFNFYGAGPDRPKIESAIRELGGKNLVLKGRVNDISEIWRDNHALLMPSRMEGLPIMMVSALLSARMCIATDIGGHAEIIQDNVSGYIVPNPSVKELAETLERAYQNRYAWEEMGLVGRQDILGFLPEDPVQDFVEKLERVVSKDPLHDQSAISV